MNETQSTAALTMRCNLDLSAVDHGRDGDAEH